MREFDVVIVLVVMVGVVVLLLRAGVLARSACCPLIYQPMRCQIWVHYGAGTRYPRLHFQNKSEVVGGRRKKNGGFIDHQTHG